VLLTDGIGWLVTRTSAFAGVLCVLAALLLAGEPGLLTGGQLLGGGTADVWGHLWGYAWVADSLLAGRLPLAGAPVSFPRPQVWWVIDLPVAVLLVPLTRVAPGLAWNAALLLPLGLGGACTSAWLQRRGVAALPSVLAALVVALSPFARGALVSGLPEALVVLLAPALLLLLEPGLRGSGRALVGASILAPLLVLDGAYGALIGGIVGAFALVEAWREARDPRALLRALPVALSALLAVALTRWALRLSEHPALISGPSRGDLREAPAWIHRALGGADLASFFVPAQLLPSLEPVTAHRHVVYVGAVLVVGAAVAALRHRAARGPALLALLIFVLALGPELRIWGQLIGLPLPGLALWELGATNAYRLAGLVPLFLVAAMGQGTRSRALSPLLGVALIEGLLAAPIPARLPSLPSPADEVTEWLSEQPTGGVLDLPFDHEGQDNRGAHPQRTFGLQAFHGQPIASGLYRTAAAVRLHKRLAQFDSAVHLRFEDPAEVSALSRRAGVRWRRIGGPPEGDQALLLEALLWREGFRYLLLDLEQIEPDQREEARAWARGWLGEPARVSEALEAWVLPERLVLPDVPPRPPRGPR
jgi:hypothetical protein